jgi:ElaA protein
VSETLDWARFAALSGLEVHDLLRLRQDVFVVEQACAFPEIDGRDPQALHLLARIDGRLVGCLRLLDEEKAMRIGRIVVGPAARGTGLGHRLMRAALARCAETAPARPVVLSAQAHLQNFYAGHGFIVVSPAYLEDEIPHVDMRRAA